MTRQTHSRFSAVSRRAALQGASLAVLVGGLSACGSNDSSALGSATTSSDPSTDAGTADTSAETSTQASAAATATPSTVTSQTASAAASTSTSTAASSSAAGGTIPSSAKGTVSFTFSSGSGGFTKNPYIAVWVEDATGKLVTTIELWYQSGHGEQWLNELTQWYQASNGDTSVSSGTRSAGSYSVAWDGTADGAKVKAGTYSICIEGAVEHGNYETLTKKVTLGSTAQKVSLGSQGDISDATFTWTV